jgi:hypothetical protein
LFGRNGQGCPRIHNGCPPLVGGGRDAALPP